MNDSTNQLHKDSVPQGCENGECAQKDSDDIRELSAAEVAAIVGGTFSHAAA